MKTTTRVRLYGGRVVHEAAPAEVIGGHYTTCLTYLSEGAINNWMPDATPISCVRCLRIKKRVQ
jgi:hypothetical protein